MNRSGLVAVLIVLGFTVLGALWLAHNLSWESIRTDSGFRDEARRNDFHAAERLLDRLGEEAVSIREIVDLGILAKTDTLIMTTPGYALDRSRSERLLDWVSRGGHLVMTVYQASPAKVGNHLLERLQAQSHDNPQSSNNPLDIRLTRESESLKVDLQGPYYFTDTGEYAFWKIGDDVGDYLLQYAWGEGLVTLISDLSVFSNERLGEHDHADFLWGLLHLDERFGKIWLQYAPRVPTLTELLFHHAWMPLLGLALTLVSAISAAGARWGPILEPRNTGQRSLYEHLQASGRFLWRQGVRQGLLRAAQQYALGRITRHLPHWRRLSREQQAQYLATLTGLAYSQIARALNPPQAITERDFLMIIRTLNTIRKKL